MYLHSTYVYRTNRYHEFRYSGYIREEMEYDETVHTSFTDFYKAIIQLRYKFHTTFSLNLVTHKVPYAN